MNWQKDVETAEATLASAMKALQGGDVAGALPALEFYGAEGALPEPMPGDVHPEMRDRYETLCIGARLAREKAWSGHPAAAATFLKVALNDPELVSVGGAA